MGPVDASARSLCMSCERARRARHQFVTRTVRVALGLAMLAGLAGCDTPPPGVDPTAWRQALEYCRGAARYAFSGEDIPGRGFMRSVNTPDWEVIDPCMEAHGFPPPI